MWKASAGHNVTGADNGADDDDWETDPDFVNDISEQEQRFAFVFILAVNSYFHSIHSFANKTLVN